jgi:hypothetical protein
VTIRFLVKNAQQMKWECQQIVEIEHIMGMYEIGTYAENKPVLPDEAKNWAKTDDDRFNSSLDVMGVFFAAVASVSSLMVDPVTKLLYVQEGRTKEISTPSVDPTYHVDITIHGMNNSEQLSSTAALYSAVEKLTETQNILIEKTDKMHTYVPPPNVVKQSNRGLRHHRRRQTGPSREKRNVSICFLTLALPAT